MNEYAQQAALAMGAVRKQKPLVHHITNFVVMNATANTTLSCGASPVMAHAKEEAAEMAGQAAALVLNIGTLWPEQLEAMLMAGRRANEKDIPVILDPVGAGATAYRTRASLELIDQLDICLVRGNAAEIAILAGLQATIVGVDSIGSDNPLEAVTAFTSRYGCGAAVTGPIDYVADGDRIYSIANGHPMMSTVSGTGCMATSVIAAYAATGDNPAKSAAAALAVYGLAGQIAAHAAKGPGTFMPLLYDSLANLTEDAVKAGARIDEVE